MQWWSLFVMCFSHLSILLKHFSVLKMRHVEKYSKTGILNFNARHNITPDKGQKMCTFPQMLCFSYLHNLIYPCWHCSWSIIINVAPGPSRYLTNHVFFVFFTSQFNDLEKDWNNTHTGEVILSNICLMLGKGQFKPKPTVPKPNQTVANN